MTAGASFSVFTATFNRAATLPRLYASLARQTDTDFEWIVVDDGSGDGTEMLVASWVQEAPFPIRYVWQPNAGKHVAFNRGVALATGDLFLPIDSDDECLPDAIGRFRSLWAAIPEGERTAFCGVTVLAAGADGVVLGDPFPADVTDSSVVEMVYRYRLQGDKWGFTRTELLRAFPFPEIPGLRYVPEGVVWSAIGRRFRTRYVNVALLVVHHDGGPGRLSNVIPRDGAGGYVLRFTDELNHDLAWFRVAPLVFIRHAANLTRFAAVGGISFRRVLADLNGPRQRGLVLLTAPLGVALVIRDRRRARQRVGRAP